MSEIEGSKVVGEEVLQPKTPEIIAQNKRYSVIFPTESASKIAGLLGSIVASEISAGTRLDTRQENEEEDIVDRLHREMRVASLDNANAVMTNLAGNDINEIRKHYEDYKGNGRLSDEEIAFNDKIVEEIDLRLKVEQKMTENKKPNTSFGPGSISGWLKARGERGAKSGLG